MLKPFRIVLIKIKQRSDAILINETHLLLRPFHNILIYNTFNSKIPHSRNLRQSFFLLTKNSLGASAVSDQLLTVNISYSRDKRKSDFI